MVCWVGVESNSTSHIEFDVFVWSIFEAAMEPTSSESPHKKRLSFSEESCPRSRYWVAFEGNLKFVQTSSKQIIDSPWSPRPREKIVSFQHNSRFISGIPVKYYGHRLAHSVRNCTDLPCLAIFVLAVIAWVWLARYGKHSPHNICNIVSQSQFSNTLNIHLTYSPKLSWTATLMNWQLQEIHMDLNVALKKALGKRSTFVKGPMWCSSIWWIAWILTYYFLAVNPNTYAENNAQTEHSNSTIGTVNLLRILLLITSLSVCIQERISSLDKYGCVSHLKRNLNGVFVLHVICQADHVSWKW